jgi:glyoxalase family protein
MQLIGIHHLTAITAQAGRNHDFYTRTLGLRLVKKTVNQDDVSAYHLFYADGKATPGTDMTFFDWPAAPERRGTNSITQTAFRVPGDASIQWWAERLEAGPAVVRDGRLTLDFEDFEGQRLSLVSDPGQSGHLWDKSSVPPEHQILGLGPVRISVPNLAPTHRVLLEVLNMRQDRQYELDGREVFVYAMGEGGAAAELHVEVDPSAPAARQGAGAAHHVAFRIPDDRYQDWTEQLARARVPSSGPVDRYYFRSLYFREPNGVLFELATEGPGFTADENLEHLGEELALPPFLEGRRQEIEAGLKPL